MSVYTAPLDALRPALLFGVAGLVPFVELARLNALDPTSAVTLLQALATYGAGILGLVCAPHWSYPLRRARDTRGRSRLTLMQYWWSVLPARVGWLALQLPVLIALCV